MVPITKLTQLQWVIWNYCFSNNFHPSIIIKWQFPYNQSHWSDNLCSHLLPNIRDLSLYFWLWGGWGQMKISLCWRLLWTGIILHATHPAFFFHITLPPPPNTCWMTSLKFYLLALEPYICLVGFFSPQFSVPQIEYPLGGAVAQKVVMFNSSW